MPHKPYEISFGGQNIVPLESTAESLGLLLSKNCYFGDHIKRIADKLRSINCRVRRNFVSRSPATMQKIYNTYLQPRIDYVSTVYNPGQAHLQKPITRAVNSFWSLCSGNPHEKFMDPKLRLMMNDLVFLHKMARGNSVLDFKTMFRQPSPLNQAEMIGNARLRRNKKLIVQKWRLKLARLRFSFRVIRPWNLLPKEIQTLKEKNFKEKVKKFILENKQAFLNLGLKDYNVVGEEYVKEVKHTVKVGPLGPKTRKFKRWNKPLNPKSDKVLKAKDTVTNPVAEKLLKITKRRKGQT